MCSSNSSSGSLFPSPALGPVGPSSESGRNLVLHFGTIVAVAAAVCLVVDVNLRLFL